LIELLVVIAIIGLLASVVLASLNSARVKARDAKRASEVKQLKLALEFYYDTNSQYPQAGCQNCGGGWAPLSGFIVPIYMPQLPVDPKGVGWDYVWAGLDSYGILVYTEKSGYCQSGVKVNPGWWGVSTMCPF
jgi:type II secretory pathway pseudopilin PulG